MPAPRAAALNAVGQGKFRRPRVPPSLFTIALGLAGLGQAWHAAQSVLGVSAAVSDAIFALAAVAWLVLVAAYAAQGWRQVLADLRDPVLGPFVPVAAITAMILGGALAAAVPAAVAAGRVLVVIFLVVTVLIGGWLTGQWIADRLDQDSMHPGYFLPTVAGNPLAGQPPADHDRPCQEDDHQYASGGERRGGRRRQRAAQDHSRDGRGRHEGPLYGIAQVGQHLPPARGRVRGN